MAVKTPDREETMKRWDSLRAYFSEGRGVDPGGSHPRDVFESIIDEYDECIASLTRELEGARAAAIEEAAQAADEYCRRDPFHDDVPGAIRALLGNDLSRARSGEDETP